MTGTAKKTNPLKEKPRHHAGQSLDEQLDVLINEKLMLYVFTAVLVVMLAGLEWYRWYHPSPPVPGVATTIALIVVAYCAFKIRTLISEIRRVKLGRDGERIVGEFLERLRETGAVVFHDIVTGDFNIDHIVVSEKGIFVVETKTFSKPQGGAKVYAEGATLRVDGLGDQTRILDQVKGNARWIRDMLKKSTGCDFETKPVVLFPGWYVEGGVNAAVWVLNPKSLPTFIGNEPQRIPMEDVKLASFHLSRLIRSMN